MLPNPVTMPGDLLNVLAREQGAGDLPTVLSGQPRWYPSTERTAISVAAQAESVRLGWVNRRGDFDPDVLAALRVLCRPTVAFFGWIHTDNRTIGVLSAAIGKQAVLGIRDGDQVSLAPGRWQRLAETLVAQTPVVPAGPGTAVRVRLAEVLGIDDRGSTLSTTRVRRQPARGAARAVKRLTELPELGTGELHVEERDELGRLSAPRQPLRYSDTSAGRYLIMVDTADGEAHALVAPADRAALVDRLTRMHRSLAG